MRRFAILALTAVCALTFTAFNLSACNNGGNDESDLSSTLDENNSQSEDTDTPSDENAEAPSAENSGDTPAESSDEKESDESDIVTDEEWLAVMNSENYNFTLDCDLSLLIYNTSTGELNGSTLNSGTAYCDLAADEDGVITGTIYESFTVEDSNPTKYEYYFVYEKDCLIQYAKYTASSNTNENHEGNSASSVEGYATASAALLADEDDAETEWKTNCSADARSKTDTYLLSMIPQLFIASYIGVYSLNTEDYFVYSETLGAYILTYNNVSDSTSIDYTYTVKIKDGNITSFGAASYVTQEGAVRSESDCNCTYYNFGTTTVNIPDDIQTQINTAYEEYLTK